MDQPHGEGQPTMVVGNHINVTLKNRQFIHDGIVTAIDSEKFEVTQRWRDSGGQWQNFAKTIMITEVDYLSGASPSIVPGTFIRVIMKKGEIIEKLKVTAADSERIIGIQHYRNSNGHWGTISNKVIMVPDIQSIKIREFSVVKTVGLVAILITSPYWLWALGVSPL